MLDLQRLLRLHSLPMCVGLDSCLYTGYVCLLGCVGASWTLRLLPCLASRATLAVRADARDVIYLSIYLSSESGGGMNESHTRLASQA